MVRAGAPAERCGTLADEPSVKESLLYDHLRVSLPAWAYKPAPDYWGALELEPSSIEVWGGGFEGVAPGEHTLVVEASETFQLDPDRGRPERLDEEAPRWIRKRLGDERVAVERVALGDRRLRAYAPRLAAPVAVPRSKRVTVAAVLVAHPDSSLQWVEVQIDAAAVERSRAACVGLGERVLASLEAGPKRLDRRGRTRVFRPVANGRDVVVDAPEGAVLLHDRGEDWNTYQLVRLRPLPEEPDFLRAVVDLYPSRNKPPTKTARGRLFGKEFWWRGERAPDRSYDLAVRVIPDDSLPHASFIDDHTYRLATEEPLYLVLVAFAPTPERVAELRGIAETIRLVPQS